MDHVPPPPLLPGSRVRRKRLAESLPLDGVASLAPPIPATGRPAGALDVQDQLHQLLAAPPQNMPPANAAGAAKDFAAILFGYMYSEMRPHEDEDGLLGGGDSEMFMNFFDQAIGKDMADGSGNQLVNALIQELTPAGKQPQPEGR